MVGGLQGLSRDCKLHENKAEEEETLLHGVKILNNKPEEMLDLQLSEIISLSSVLSPDRPFPPPTQMPSSMPPSGHTCEAGSAATQLNKDGAATVATYRRSWELPRCAELTSDPPAASGPGLPSREQELSEPE